MEDRILVTYASYYGSTAEVAETIAEALSADGVVVDVSPVAAVTGLDRYRAVVVGSPRHSGQWLPEAVAFLEKYKAALSQMPVAFFIMCYLGNNSAETRRAKLASLETMRILLKPVSIGVFAGLVDYSKLSMIHRLKAQTKGLAEGDFRNWEAIRRWAEELRPALLEVCNIEKGEGSTLCGTLF